MRVRARLRRGPIVAVAGVALATAVASGCSDSDHPARAGTPACPRATHTPPPARGGLTLGLNSVWNDGCDLAAIRGAGVTMERLEVGWPQVEPARGRWSWRGTDHRFREAASHGITILPLLTGVPAWTGAASNTIPSNPTGFSRYVARVVRRYGPRGSFWRHHRRVPYHPAVWFEIWNEPYLVQFSNGGPRPGAYARLFRSAASAGRRANRRAKFLIAADTSGVAQSGRLTPWVNALYSAVPHLNRYFDGVAVHPYSAPRGPLVYIPGANARFEFRRIERLRQQFVSRGAGAKPFWITEVGWSTCPALTADCVSEGRQAAYIAQVLSAVRKNYLPWVRAVFLYNYRDPPTSTNPGDKEHWFGLIRRDGSPKPAWSVLRANASQ